MSDPADKVITVVWKLKPELRYTYLARYTRDPVWRAVYARRLKQVRGETKYP